MADNPNGQGAGDQGDQKIKIDDKEYTLADVKNLVTNAAATAAKAAEVSKIMDAAKAYDLTPEELLEQSMGAIQVVGNLMEKGIIDQEGNIIFRKDESQKPSTPPIKPGLKPGVDSSMPFTGDAKAIMEGLQAVQEGHKSLMEMVNDVRTVQTGLIREMKGRDIKAVYPDLNDEDISRVFGTAIDLRKAGKKADLLEVAKTVSEAKAIETVAIVKDFAVKHGLDYDKIVSGADPNSLREQIAKGGAGVLLGGKKLTFNPDPKKNEISPLEASQALFKAQAQQ